MAKVFATSKLNPAKRTVQRRVLWRAIANRRRYPGLKLNVVCLPGESGYDVEFFLQHPNVGRIYAVEENQDIAVDLKKRYRRSKRVTVVPESTTSFFLKYQGVFHIVYLDYYSTLSSLVKADITLLLRRKLIEPGSKLITCFYSARGPRHEHVQHILDAQDFFAYSGLDHNMSYDTIESLPNTKLLQLAFHGFLVRCRYVSATPARPKTPHGIAKGTEGVYAGFRVPTWYTYDSTSAPMLIADTSLRSLTTGSNGYSRDLFDIDPWKIEGDNAEPKRFSAKGTHHHMWVKEADEYWVKLIKDYYEKHHVVPTREQAKETSGSMAPKGSWTRRIREAGLCPRLLPTLEEIKEEVKRIYHREGYVNNKLCEQAKILRKLQQTHGVHLTDLLRELHIPNRPPKPASKMIFLQGWLDHLKQGLPRRKFKHYAWVVKYGYLDEDRAREALRFINRRLEGKR